MSKGSRIDVRDKDGWTPLHTAAFRGRQGAANCLLDHDSDLMQSAIRGALLSSSLLNKNISLLSTSLSSVELI